MPCFCQGEWQSDAQLLLKLGVGYWFIGHPGINMHLTDSIVAMVTEHQ